MNFVLAKIGNGRKIYRKIQSDCDLYDLRYVNDDCTVEYSDESILDVGEWFCIRDFLTKKFCIDLLKNEIDSKNFLPISRSEFDSVSWIISVQERVVLFQKVTPSLHFRKKILYLGDAVKLSKGDGRIVINDIPDAVFFIDSNNFLFKNIATINSLFVGIDSLYKEATRAEVEVFLSKPFIKIDAKNYNADTVSKPNRKRISLATKALENLDKSSMDELFNYIYKYGKGEGIKFEKENERFVISSDKHLKCLLLGVCERYYTTPVSGKRRLANSVIAID